MADDAIIEIVVPQQAVYAKGSWKEAEEFFKKEIDFFDTINGLMQKGISHGGTGYGDPRITQQAKSQLKDIISAIGKHDDGRIKEYERMAQNLTILVGQGCIGKKVLQLQEENRKEEARWVVYLIASSWISNQPITEVIGPYRAALSGNPATFAFSNLSETSQALKDASLAKKMSQGASAQLDKFIEEKTAVISRLEDVYREKLTLEEPARFWDGICRSKTVAWRIWMFIFAVLVVGPILSAIWNWSVVTEHVSRLTPGNQGISIAGLAMITIPALFYAWFLKNVSRMFVQNLTLADDAAHRRALAITYLGLAENPKLSISEQDRALILNALFRPILGQSSDEGPPAGLLELIKGKS